MNSINKSPDFIFYNSVKPQKGSAYSGIYFRGNFSQNVLKFDKADFFVKIRGYGKDKDWAKDIIATADTAVNMIRKNTSVDNILKFISMKVRKANSRFIELAKRTNSGILRCPREGWLNVDNGLILYTPIKSSRYKVYADRFEKICENPLNNPYKNISLSEIHKEGNNCVIVHGDSYNVNNALNFVFSKYRELVPKYIDKNFSSEDLNIINSNIAEIRWVLAHSTPWLRGSDSISNVFIRSIYKALGIKTYPLAKNISLDLEAYCTNLTDYKNKFVLYFEKPPEVISNS